MPFFSVFCWTRVERPHADVDAVDVARVADATVNDDAFPAVLVGQDGQLVADQGAAQRAAAIDDQHLALAVFAEDFAHQRVVLEQLEGDDLAGAATAAIALEHRGDDTNGLAEFGFDASHRSGVLKLMLESSKLRVFNPTSPANSTTSRG